jgi:hypothetical protein
MGSNQEPVGPEKKATGELPAVDPRLAAAERQALDARVLAGEAVAPDALKSALRGALPSEELKRAYAEMLLRHALDARDAEASGLVARLMDEDTALDESLEPLLEERLNTAPDEVYAFVRARLSESTNERWLARLKQAARSALDVAVTDGDAETTVNWLKLVSREPASYGLGDLLHSSLLAAGERAHADGELGRSLLGLSVRRDPAAFETLLADPALLAVMNNNLGNVLRDHQGEVMTTLQNQGAEMFLVALTRAAQARNPALFTSTSVDQLWAYYTGAQASNPAPQYSADKLVTLLLNEGAVWLDNTALQSLLTLTLRDKRDDLFVRLAHQLAERDNFTTLLGSALQKSARSETEINALVTQLTTSGDLSPLASVDLYGRVLTTLEWRKSALPLIQQWARTLNQHPTLTATPDALWRALDAATEAKDEGIARTVARRLTAELEATEDENAFAEALLRLYTVVQWNAAVRQYVVTWLRGFVREAALARLQRLDKALDGKKALDELRPILQSVIAFRKLLGKRNLQQFAWDVGVAYGILQALTESFEPSPRRPMTFDQQTIRAELDARADDLTPHETQILANNFKELAQLIANMGDNRSKASLMRRGDDVDRQLMIGEQQPHSAVDALKWLAGYLSGAQEKDEDAEE